MLHPHLGAVRQPDGGADQLERPRRAVRVQERERRQECRGASQLRQDFRSAVAAQIGVIEDEGEVFTECRLAGTHQSDQRLICRCRRRAGTDLEMPDRAAACAHVCGESQARVQFEIDDGFADPGFPARQVGSVIKSQMNRRAARRDLLPWPDDAVAAPDHCIRGYGRRGAANATDAADSTDAANSTHPTDSTDAANSANSAYAADTTDAAFRCKSSHDIPIPCSLRYACMPQRVRHFLS